MCREPSESLHERLVSLGVTPDPEEVDRLVGFPITFPECQECGERVEKAVQIGSLSRDGERPPICRSCLVAAVQLLDR